MNRKQRKEEFTRAHLERMADANSIELIRRVDSLGNVDWLVKAYTTFASGRVQYIGGASIANYEAAVEEAHRYATLPGSHTLSQRI